MPSFYLGTVNTALHSAHPLTQHFCKATALWQSIQYVAVLQTEAGLYPVSGTETHKHEKVCVNITFLSPPGNHIF